MRSRRSLLLALLAATAAPLAAQPAAAPAFPLQVDVDAAAFRYDGATSLVEAYLAFGAESLPYERREGRFVAEFPVRVTVRRAAQAAPAEASAAPVFADTLALAFAVADTAGLVQGQYFVQQVRAAVPPGEYELEVEVPALTGRASLALRRDLAVPDFGGAGAAERAMVSDLALAADIRAAEDGEAASPFYKNGLIVQPNPNGLYGQGLPGVFYYAEAYGLDDAVADEAYTLLAYVAEANLPQPIPGLQRRTERPVRSPDVVVGSFDVGGLPSGSYYLRLAFLDAENEAVAEQSRKFFVYNPGVARPQVVVDDSYETSLYAAMPGEEVEENLLHAAVIATGRERQQIAALATADAKREFLAGFWRRRDNSPSTSVNEARRDFYERVQYADDRYANAYAEGWQTDRGRVVLEYGRPSSVTPRSFGADTVPHEIWEYDNIPGEGRSTFVFADRNGFGDYELIHSDVSGEISQIDWQDRLRR